MKRRWRRVGDGVYQYEEGAYTPVVLATVERLDPPNNSHFSLWEIRGEKIHHPTLRDAKARVERQQAARDALDGCGYL